MADCGICLDVLRSPVSIPCGHVHCERCLRNHISSGTDALKSLCPTCRKAFHIATPDFAFVPQKYHDFILPTVRRIYMDVPSIVAMSREIDDLTRRLESFSKENDNLRQRCTDYKYMIDTMASEKGSIIAQEEGARRETVQLRRKYDALKRKYQEALRDNTSTRFRSSQNAEASREILPKEEELPVSLQDLNYRPKRALPKSRLSNSICCREEPLPPFVKRQRIRQHSDIGSGQLLGVSLKYEEEEEEEGEEEEEEEEEEY